LICLNLNFKKIKIKKYVKTRMQETNLCENRS
jgi:hypothetical protein